MKEICPCTSQYCVGRHKIKGECNRDVTVELWADPDGPPALSCEPCSRDAIEMGFEIRLFPSHERNEYLHRRATMVKDEMRATERERG